MKRLDDNMKSRDEAVRYLLGVAKDVPEHENGFVIAYPDDCNEIRYVDQYGSPMLKAPKGMTVIQAQNKEQAELWVNLYESMGDSFIIGDIEGKNLDNMALFKISDNFYISI